MSSDDQEKTYQQHAQLINQLPKADGWFGQHVFLYQGQWLLPNIVLGATLMQNHFNHRSTDIFLSSFPKSGTTWLKSLMFAIINRSRFDFSDHPLLRQGPQSCFPAFGSYISQDHAISNMDNLPSPRLFASHFMYSLFPSTFKDPSSGCKFIYVCRDPKDAFISMFHFMKHVRKELPPLSFDKVFGLFCEGVADYGPYWDHVLGYWKASIESPDKILFLRYEEMKKEPHVYVKKLAEFMGVPVSVEEEENGMVEKIATLCSFEHLKNLEVNKTGTLQIGNRTTALGNHVFFRRGEVGDWKNHLTKEMGAKIDQITEEKFKGSGLTFESTPK